jgi:hypothetical protein
MVRTPSVVQNGDMTTNDGWLSYASGGDNSHLTAKQRRIAEEGMRERRRRRGALLAIVVVRVFENGEVPQVSFPTEATLGPNSDSSAISEVVNRASEALADWRLRNTSQVVDETVKATEH